MMSSLSLLVRPKRSASTQNRGRLPRPSAVKPSKPFVDLFTVSLSNPRPNRESYSDGEGSKSDQVEFENKYPLENKYMDEEDRRQCVYIRSPWLVLNDLVA
jgi:hypothetical protein